VITVRTTGFDAAKAEGGSARDRGGVDREGPALPRFVGESLAKSDRPELTAARVVVSGGRGMQNGENFKLLEAWPTS
jgi:electron transfer flavoprotein alpha subunit